MKKIVLGVIVVFALVLVVLGSVVGNNNNSAKEGYLRIHIRANSNAEADQNVKYQIKDKVVFFLTPLLKNVKMADDAMKIVNNNLDNLTDIATKELQLAGFKYSAKARLSEEYFPSRTYNDLVLVDGVYDALIIELGSAIGNNWWCVVYPPLCFISSGSGAEDVQYKSYLYQFFKNLFKK